MRNVYVRNHEDNGNLVHACLEHSGYLFDVAPDFRNSNTNKFVLIPFDAVNRDIGFKLNKQDEIKIEGGEDYVD